jgi:hypothetical protein
MNVQPSAIKHSFNASGLVAAISVRPHARLFHETNTNVHSRPRVIVTKSICALANSLRASRFWSLGLPFTLMVALGAAGCGDDTPEADPIAYGIYQIEVYISYDENCMGSGTDLLPDTPGTHLVLFADTIYGLKVTRLLSCLDISDCTALRTAFLSMESGPVPAINYTFQATTAGRLKARMQSTGYTTENGTCRAPERVDSTTSFGEDSTLEVTSETRVGADYPETAEGFCTTELGAMATEDAACTKRTVIRARFESE